MLERLHRNGKGFTLIELMIVIAIIAILAAIAIPNFMAARRRARISADKQQLSSYATALEVYATDESLGDGKYPTAADLDALITKLKAVGSDGVTVAMKSAKAKDLGGKDGTAGTCTTADVDKNSSSDNLYTLCVQSINISGTATKYIWTAGAGAGW